MELNNNKLQILDKNLPLKAYPDESLNRAILTGLMPFISRLLSLSSESSAERLEIALPAIKEHCYGMGFSEIKNMFELYADSKLNIEPIPNYFDRILLGKIVSNYRQQKQVKTKVDIVENTLTEAQSELVMLGAVERIEKEYKEKKKITERCFHVYDYLKAKGLITKDYFDIYEKAKEEAIRLSVEEAGSFYDKHCSLRETIENIKSGKTSKAVNIAKRMILEDYFENKLNK